MKQSTHKNVAIKACNLLGTIDGSMSLLSSWHELGNGAYHLDDLEDLEFVDVDMGKDNPHEDSFWEDSDEAHYKEEGRCLTANNHFIDIKKGLGDFDDYDGYSYQHGSAKSGQYQAASDATDDPWEGVLTSITGMKVDEGLAWWFNDEYVHAPPHSWYQNCSPAIERYSFYGDKNIYGNKNDELGARFPRSNNTGTTDKGIPYSVFMPLDNLARYWLSTYSVSQDANHLGYVLHAIHDATIPHHAAGYCGNWHSAYESDLDENFDNYWVNSDGFDNEVIDLFYEWYKHKSPPTSLSENDWNLVPGKNWRIDYLVTWLALNSYREYKSTYNNYRNGYSFDLNSAKDLMVKATAMTMLVIARASGFSLPPSVPPLSRNARAGILRIGRRIQNITLSKPLITVNKVLHNYGVVWPGEKSTTTFKITSSGKGVLRIRSISNPKTSQFKIESITPANKTRLRRGETLSIKVSFTRPEGLRYPRKPKDMKLARKSPLYRLFQDEIVIQTNAQNSPLVVLQLKAGGRLPYKKRQELMPELRKISEKMANPRVTMRTKNKLKIRSNELKRLKDIIG